jgi:DNA-binding response OmpR family regulator
VACRHGGLDFRDALSANVAAHLRRVDEGVTCSGEVGEVGHPVVAHAPGELERGVLLLRRSPWAVKQARLQVLTRTDRLLPHSRCHRDSSIGELALCVRVGEVRDAVRPHALGELRRLPLIGGVGTASADRVRASAHNRPPVREIAGLRLDPFRREVFRDGRYVALTRKQFAVLDVLVAAEGGVVSAEELLERAWDENADPFTNAVRITVSALRKRLGEPWLIATVAGVGYRIDTAPGTEERR